jgi:hypothetical protein
MCKVTVFFNALLTFFPFPVTSHLKNRFNTLVFHSLTISVKTSYGFMIYF